MNAHSSAPQHSSASQPLSSSAPQQRRWSTVLLAAATGVSALLFILAASPSVHGPPSVLESLDAGDFAKWYRQQSAATWFGSSTMKSKEVRGRALKVEHWLSKTDLKGIPAVLKQQAAQRRKEHAIQVALDAGLRNQGSGGARGRKQQLFQILDEGETKYMPHHGEGDFADLPRARVEGILNKLENKFLNHTSAELDEHEESMKPMTPEEIAKAKAEELKRRMEEEENERQMAAASPKLKKLYNQEVEEHKKQTEKLNDLSSFITTLYNSTGYKKAVITQCGDHCAEERPASLTPST